MGFKVNVKIICKHNQTKDLISRRSRHPFGMRSKPRSGTIKKITTKCVLCNKTLGIRYI